MSGQVVRPTLSDCVLDVLAASSVVIGQLRHPHSDRAKNGQTGLNKYDISYSPITYRV